MPTKQEFLDLFGKVAINSFNIMNLDQKSIGVGKNSCATWFKCFIYYVFLKPRGYVTGLYLEASVLDHSCRPNAQPIFDGKTLVVRCVSPKGNKKRNTWFLKTRAKYLLCPNITRNREVRRCQNLLRRSGWGDGGAENRAEKPVLFRLPMLLGVCQVDRGDYQRLWRRYMQGRVARFRQLYHQIPYKFC